MVHGQTCRRTRVILAPYPLVCPQPGSRCASVLQLCSTSALEGSCTAHRGVNLCLAHPANEKMQWQLLVPLTPEGRGKLFFLLTSRSCQALIWDSWVPLLHQEAQPHPFFAGVRQHQMLSVSPSEGASWRKKGARIHTNENEFDAQSGWTGSTKGIWTKCVVFHY